MDGSFHGIFSGIYFKSPRIKTIKAKIAQQTKINGLSKNEILMHNKEGKQLSRYYKKLGEVIKNYKRIILFGPTNVKVELFDVLSEDEQFVKIKIEIKDTDKMTEDQKSSFVTDYFSKA
jgi:hypothetical protein